MLTLQGCVTSTINQPDETCDTDDMVLTVVGDFPAGMISYWKFEEGSGSTTAFDSVGDNDGTLFNGPQWTSGIVGGALSFDGVDDYVRGPQPTYPVGTIEAWVKLNSYPTGNRYGIVSGNTISIDPDPGCQFSEVLEVQPNGTASYYFWDGYAIKRPTGTTTLNLDEWYHLVVTVAATGSGYEIILYVNGLEEGRETGVGIVAPQPYFYFSFDLYCWNYDFSHDAFDGALDEVAFYNRALTPEEIQQHYQNGLNGLGYEYQDGTDSDGDGVADSQDQCPGFDDNVDVDQDGIPDGCDTCPNDPDNDIDGDGICGDVDGCPNDPDNDIDGDGICGDVDGCPNDPDNDIDGDGICGDVDGCPNDPDNDIDGDGICGDVDGCPNDPNNDADEDGVCGDVDNCPASANSDQANFDGDSLGDVCDPDDDNDGVPDSEDVFPFDPTESADSDGDGIGNNSDNCPANANADQIDSDGDGLGNSCDVCAYDSNNDADDDGICGDVDNCPADPNTDQADLDSDGIGNVCDTCPNDAANDADSDGICGDVDNCPDVANTGQSDIDSDGAGDLCDVCPADPLDNCNSEGSTAEEIPADQGGTVSTPDEDLTLDIPADAVDQDMTISVTQTNHQDEDIDLLIGPSEGLGRAVAVYDLEPDGHIFDSPVTINVSADVTHLNENQRDKLGLYQWDEITATFVPVSNADCYLVEDPLGTFIKTCTAQLTHFSLYAMVAPRDSDDDGIPDLFGDEQDLCPTLSAEESMSIDYTGDLVLPVGVPANAKVELKDANGEYLVSVPLSISCTDGNGYSYGECAAVTDPSGTASCSVENLVPGVYTVMAESVEPGCPYASTQALLAVYDPDGGFVTGGGWINSPEGAYTADPSLTGKANFGFVSKYKKGATVPTGNTEFNFKTGDLNFHSNTYEWLVVNQSGTNAQFKGSGTINGDLSPTGEAYKFMLWAGDGAPDTFRIRIWEEDEFGVEIDVYDNGVDQVIGGGSIKVHTQ
jgi:hypothetical protein